MRGEREDATEIVGRASLYNGKRYRGVRDADILQVLKVVKK